MVKKNFNSIINYYKKRINRFGFTNKGLAWESKKKNDLRYFSIFKVINKKKISKINILDFGCGISGLYDFLKKKKLSFNYTGLDTSQKAIDFCKKKYKKNKYIRINILKEKKSIGKFDIIIMNGIFTIRNRMSERQMYDYIMLILQKLKRSANGKIIINFFIENPEWKNEKNFYPNYKKLTNLIKEKITKKIRIIKLEKIFENILVLDLQ